jgi:hypothetical protein
MGTSEKIERSPRRVCEAGISLVLLDLLLSLAPGEGKMGFVISSTSFPNGGDIQRNLLATVRTFRRNSRGPIRRPAQKASHSSPTILMLPPGPGPLVVIQSATDCQQSAGRREQN